MRALRLLLVWGLLYFCSGKLWDNCHRSWHKEYRMDDWGSVKFELQHHNNHHHNNQHHNDWKMCMDKSPHEFIIRIDNDTSCNSHNWVIRSVHCRIGSYLAEFCKYHGCRYQVQLEVNDSVWFNIYNTSLLGKKIIVDDVQQLLDNKTIIVDEAYLLRKWSILLTRTSLPYIKIYNVRLVDKQNLSYDSFDSRSAKIKTTNFDCLYDLLKDSRRDDYRIVFESEQYTILLKPWDEYRDIDPTYTYGEIRKEIARKTQDLAELIVNYPPAVSKPGTHSPINRLRWRTSSILAERKPMHQNTLSTYLVRDSVEDIIPIFDLFIHYITQLEKSIAQHTPTCDWKGGKWLFGDRGCEDDVYIYCEHGKVQSFEQGC